MAGKRTAVDGRERVRRFKTLERAGLVSVATLSSRVLGVAREHLFAKILGAGNLSDAFVIAYRIPNLFRDLFAEGALSSAFVPVFTEYRQNRGEGEALRLAQVVFSALFLVVGAITVSGILGAEGIVALIAPGFGRNPEKQELTVALTRWLMPFLLLMSWAALCRGILNTYHRYFLPALSPALFNVVAVAAGWIMWWLRVPPERAVYGWAITTLLGGAVTFLVQTPDLWRVGIRLRLVLALRDPGLRRIMALMGPATIGLTAVQVTVLVNSILSSLLEPGAPSWLNYAYRIVYLPIGVVGVAVATVTTVNLSEHAARSDWSGFRSDLLGSLRFVAFLSLPAAVGLIMLAEPIVRLVYEYGRFSTRDTGRTAAALVGYATALFFYNGVKVLVPAFFALNRMKIPVVASLFAVAVNIGWSLATFRLWGFVTLAIGTAIAASLNFVILCYALGRSLPGDGGRLHLLIVKLAMLAIPVAAGIASLHSWLDQVLGSDSVTTRSVAVFAPVIAALIVWFAGGLLLGLDEAADILGALRGRGGRRTPRKSLEETPPRS